MSRNSDEKGRCLAVSRRPGTGTIQRSAQCWAQARTAEWSPHFGQTISLVWKRLLCAVLYYKTEYLPRQARDKYNTGKVVKKRDDVSAGRIMPSEDPCFFQDTRGHLHLLTHSNTWCEIRPFWNQFWYKNDVSLAGSNPARLARPTRPLRCQGSVGGHRPSFFTKTGSGQT
jgi:hypothetical protein